MTYYVSSGTLNPTHSLRQTYMSADNWDGKARLNQANYVAGTDYGSYGAGATDR